MRNLFIILFCWSAFSGEEKVNFPIDVENNPKRIVWDMGNKYSSNLKELLSFNVSSGKVDKRPWSGYYWPFVTGSIAARVSDEGFNRITRSYQAEIGLPYLVKYLRDFNPNNYVSLPTRLLSPAEKYDLWLGDKNFHLTDSSLKESMKYFNEQNGNLPKWFGLCHGWAPASVMLDRPLKPVSMPVGNTDKKIIFYPKDIKALATLAWTKKKQRVIGRRCNQARIDYNNRGRIDLSCLDLNPGTFHIALLNQIGINKKPFILDVTNNSEVWNHPVSSYTVKYFHPTERLIYQSFDRNIAPIENVSLYRAYRAPRTKYIVGAMLTFNFVNENYNLSRTTDHPNFDSLKQKTVYYDLELDANYNIIGGEWLSSNYPDFAWIPARETHHVHGEKGVTLVDQDGRVNSAGKALALGGILGQYKYQGFSKYNMPLPSLVRYLIQESRK